MKIFRSGYKPSGTTPINNEEGKFMKVIRQILGQKLEDSTGMSVSVSPITITIELTNNEIMDAYRLKQKYYDKCDLIHKINEMIGSDDDCEDEIKCNDDDEIKIGNITLTGKQLKEIVSNPDFMDDLVKSFENALEWNNSYWERFWSTAEYVIKEAIEDEMNDEEEK